MKIYFSDGAGFPRLVGRADVPADHAGPFLAVRPSGAAGTITAHFFVGPIPCVAPPYDAGPGERIVPLRPGQTQELLPGWTPPAA